MASYHANMLKTFSYLFLVVGAASAAQLSSGFYEKSCPKALPTIKAAVDSLVSKEPRMGASLFRLFFHDCFVQGCDGSVLLDESETVQSEKNALPNHNSARGFDVIEDIKAEVESLCRETVSCADILAVAARDAVAALSGPSWEVALGRRDSTNASFVEASKLPSPRLNLTVLVSVFRDKGFTARELVALSGAHTIGKSQCRFFRDRLYNQPYLNSSLAASLRAHCPEIGGDDNLSALDASTPQTFDNAYFVNLGTHKGLLGSDQQLLSGDGSTAEHVVEYAGSGHIFRTDFADAMRKMGRLSPLTGRQGEIRVVCNKPNRSSN